MENPRGEGAWWRSAGASRNWVTPSATPPSGDRVPTHREFAPYNPPANGQEYAYGQQAAPAAPAGGHTLHDGGVDSLIDGVLGGTATTVIEHPTETQPRPKNLVWPPRPREKEDKDTFARKPGRLQRLRSTQRGTWTYRGLRPRWRVLIVAFLVAAIVAAAVATMRSIAASAANNFPGVLAAESPLQLNFPATGTISKIDVAVGQHVRIGQALASEANSTLAAQLVADRTTLASDEENLAQLLGPVGASTEKEAAAAYARAEQQSTVTQQRGSEDIASDEGILSSEEASAAAIANQLSSLQQQYASKCANGIGTSSCASMERQIGTYQTDVDSWQTRIDETQSRLGDEESTDNTLAGIAKQENALALENKTTYTQTALTALTGARDAVAEDQAKYTADFQALQATNLVSPVPGEILSISGLVGELAPGDGGVHTPSTGGSPVPGSSPSSGSPTGIGSSASGNSFITIEEEPGLEAVAQVPESSILSVHRGESVTISVDALGGQSFPGHVALVEPSPVVISGAVYYDVLIIPDTDWSPKLLPGMTSNISFQG